MIHFIFKDEDSRWCFLKYDTPAEYMILHKDMMDWFNLTDPICYLPTYKGLPFKDEFIWEYRQKSGDIIFYFSTGLAIPVWKWLKDHELQCDGLEESRFKNKLTDTFDDFKKRVNSWNMSIGPRDYQYEAAWKALQWKRSLSSISTRAGKTVISYMIFRYASEVLGAKRILMIVPSVELVKQGFSDFNEYAEYFKGECLWSGGKCVESSNLTIATFQTLVNFLDKKSKRYNPSFFNGYDVVFIDETHRANARSVKEIISQPFMKDVKLAFGMTGTLPKDRTIERFCLHALLGPKIQEISPRELMDGGYLSDIRIIQHRLRYKDLEKQEKVWTRCAEYCLSNYIEEPDLKNPAKKIRKELERPEFLIKHVKTFPEGLAQAKALIASSYEDRDAKRKAWKKTLDSILVGTAGASKLHVEVMTVHFFEERIDYLINEILPYCPRNTLILAQHVEYIKHVADRIKEAFPDRHTVCVHGASKDRKQMKDIFKNNDDVIMVANYAIVGTGITLSNLFHGVLFESYKSEVINIQGIGRGLAKADGKNAYELHDITDCFDKDIASNKIFLQGLQRIKLYKEYRYPYKVIEREI